MDQIKNFINSCLKDEDLKNEFLDNIKNFPKYVKAEFKLEKIKRINIGKGDKRTAYPGITIDCSRPFAIITGRENTGKTTTYDKIRHFFVLFPTTKSLDKRWITKFSADFILKDSTNHQYTIQVTYDSGSTPKSKLFLFDETQVFGKQEIENPFVYLKKNSVVCSKFQITKFSGENNVLIKFLTTKDIFEEFLFSEKFKLTNNLITEGLEKRNRELNKYKNLINEKYKTKKQILTKEKELKKEIKKIENFLSLETEITNFQNEIEKKEETKNKVKLVRNEMKSLSKKRENYDQNLDILDEELKRIKELHKRNQRFEDLFVESRPLICLVCDQPIPESEAKVRISKNQCYCCGINDFLDFYESEKSNFMIEDYSAEQESINTKRIELRYKIKESDEQIITLKKEIEIEKEIDLNGLYYSLSYSKNEFKEESKKRKDHLERLETRLKFNENWLNRIENEIESYSNRMKEIFEIISQIGELKRSFKEYTELQLEKDVEFILNRINYYFTRYNDQRLGKIVITDNNLELAHKFRDSEDNKLHKRSIKQQNILSNVNKRKLEISFCFAFQDYIMYKKYESEPRFLVVDSFDDFKPDVRQKIISDLENLVKSNYQIILFANIIDPQEIRKLNHTRMKLKLNENLVTIILDSFLINSRSNLSLTEAH